MEFFESLGPKLSTAKTDANTIQLLHNMHG